VPHGTIAKVDDYDARIRQIELLEFTNRVIHEISRRFGIGLVLEALRGACLVAGDTRMVDVLMNGDKAFEHLRKIDPLVEALGTRERRRLDRISATCRLPVGEATSGLVGIISDVCFCGDVDCFRELG